MPLLSQNVAKTYDLFLGNSFCISPQNCVTGSNSNNKKTEALIKLLDGCKLELSVSYKAALLSLLPSFTLEFSSNVWFLVVPPKDKRENVFLGALLR